MMNKSIITCISRQACTRSVAIIASFPFFPFRNKVRGDMMNIFVEPIRTRRLDHISLTILIKFIAKNIIQ